VKETVREAGRIPFETFANRTSGSVLGVLLALAGYVLLVIRHSPFILALPLIGIGIFSLWGGLRFTVYAVPVAAMSAIYLFYFLSQQFIPSKKVQLLVVALLTALMIYPNITHIIGYKVPTVLNKAEVQDLAKLNKISDTKDYTLAWWDYGYPIWYYSDTNTLIDGGKHNNDNFIISKIMQTTSPQVAANLSRLAVEKYVDSNYSIVANKIFEGVKDPNLMLDEMQDENYKLPAKTRDIYLYMPYRMLNIFPTVMLFGNLDLSTGKSLRKVMFYPTSLRQKRGTELQFANGIKFDAKRGEIILGTQAQKVRYFVSTQYNKSGKIVVQSQKYDKDAQFVVLYMKSYNRFIVMDIKTFGSMYVQMFVLGNYDKKLFELVVSSPYSKIYKLKK
jgi:dolichyl-diphosphooligosaccharide--protein glycosyltransferase/undecaprenyl-diphosphooligosaccharide--protein glycosyltransferase